MDIKLELEIKAKAFENFKLLLNKKDTTILFNDFKNNDVIQNAIITNDEHKYILTKKYKDIKQNIFNKKFNFLLPNKLRNIPNKKQQKVEINKLKYIKILKFIFRLKLFKDDFVKKTIYTLNYNGIIYNINETEYNKIYFYTEYAYKIYQLKKLNKNMDIKQNITLYFDEDVFSINMYNKFFNIVKDIFE